MMAVVQWVLSDPNLCSKCVEVTLGKTMTPKLPQTLCHWFVVGFLIPTSLFAVCYIIAGNGYLQLLCPALVFVRPYVFESYKGGL